MSGKVKSTQTDTEVRYQALDTERKKAEAELQRSVDRFRSLVIATGQIIWTNSAEGKMVGEQTGWASMTGQSFEEYQGYGWSTAVHPEDRTHTLEQWEESVRTHSLFAIEHRVRRFDGEYRHFAVRGVPVLEPDGKVREWVGSHTDITDRKQAAEEILRAKEEAESANRTKTLFLANMSHELRTPLNAVIGYSEMLQEEAQDLGAQRLVPDLEKINTAGKHLLSLINDVLDLSKIEAGKMDLYLETFRVKDVVQEVADTVAPLLAKNEDSLMLDCEPDLGEMHADLTKLRQSLFNLLSNASKFTHQGQIRLSVRREAGTHGVDQVFFAVSDTGIGMNPKQQGRLFEVFSQADPSTTRRFGGTGLGLAISRRFCQMMGGDIQVHSEEGRGSTFTIRVPALVSPQENETQAGTGKSAPEEASSERTVLVIDDDADTRELMRRHLSREGIRAETASSGDEGLRLAKKLRPMVITLDVMMPGMDGWSVLSALKADPDLSDIPVVMISMVSEKNLGYALGAADYLSKPVDRNQLSRVLGRYRCLVPPCPVLLVEDDAITRQMMKSMLEKEGWVVQEAENGQVALDRVAENRPSLILLDLMMPEMDGFEFVAQLRRHPEWHSIPVVVLTAKDVTEEERRRLKGYVEKILYKGAQGRDQLMNEVRRMVTSLCKG